MRWQRIAISATSFFLVTATSCFALLEYYRVPDDWWETPSAVMQNILIGEITAIILLPLGVSVLIRESWRRVATPTTATILFLLGAQLLLAVWPAYRILELDANFDSRFGGPPMKSAMELSVCSFVSGIAGCGSVFLSLRTRHGHTLSKA